MSLGVALVGQEERNLQMDSKHPPQAVELQMHRIEVGLGALLVLPFHLRMDLPFLRQMDLQLQMGPLPPKRDLEAQPLLQEELQKEKD